ncbi:MAG: C40 family peptidase [Bacteroidales bacterium]|nr:C40 family peptidase [Bacteroidales bacterium]
MEFGINLQSIVPVRKEPSHLSEMTTQLLFGELFRIYETYDGWHQVRLAWDNYEGWIPEKQARMIEEQEFLQLMNADTPAVMDLVQLIANESQKTMFAIPLGSSMPGLEGQFFSIAGENFRFEGQVSITSGVEEIETPQEKKEFCHDLVEDATMYLHTPYLWGGRSPFGIDCSGLVQMVYRLRQIKLLRDAPQQATQGEVVTLLDEAEPGDIAFFDDEEGNINHVGILADRFRIIHASGNVRIDAIDHQGIYDGKQEKYTHKLRLIKRII